MAIHDDIRIVVYGLGFKKETKMKTIVGTRPSGRLHLGHYASVIKPALEDANTTVMIARYHAPSGDAEDMYDQLTKHGVRLPVFQELDSMLLFKLLEVTPSHLLKAMPQYKATKDKSALMYIYPVLMAHDIAKYDRVIVGEDQRPHIELANDILPRLGLKAPEAIYDSGKIMDLRHPESKMSKSEPNSCLFLDDANYERKIMKAVTTDEGRKNLESIFYLLGGKELPTENKILKDRIINLYGIKFVKEAK
jgi:tryptophanyl-tRNA synthetase